MDRRETTRYLLRFSFPIMGGNVFQQLYNTLDSVIVSRYLGENGLAAVGVASPVMSLLIFLIFGVGLGMTVLLAQRYGSGDLTCFRRYAVSALCGGLVLCVPLVALCILFSRIFLVLTHTPPEVMADALAYLRVVFLGLFFTFLYNYHSAALMAIGDSRTPFFSLLISSGLNVALDILFVGRLSLGVAGAAWATVAAQGVSALLCLWYVFWRRPELSFRRAELRIDWCCLKEIGSYSGASALQQTVLYGGRLLVQSAVNPLGVSIIAGYNAACRLESFLLVPMEGIASAVASFCAKRYGALDHAGVRQGFASGIGLSAVYNVVMSITIWLFAPRVIGLFRLDSRAASEAGVAYLRCIVLFYLLVSGTQMLQALFRGLGRLRITIQNSALQITLRVILTYACIDRLGIRAVCLGTVAGWLAMILYSGFLARGYFRTGEVPSGRILH